VVSSTKHDCTRLAPSVCTGVGNVFGGNRGRVAADRGLDENRADVASTSPVTQMLVFMSKLLIEVLC